MWSCKQQSIIQDLIKAVNKFLISVDYYAINHLLSFYCLPILMLDNEVLFSSSITKAYLDKNKHKKERNQLK